MRFCSDANGLSHVYGDVIAIYMIKVVLITNLEQRQKSAGIFVRENIKEISIVIKNVIWCEKSLMHKAERPSDYFSNSFTYNQAEQIKKGAICVQTLLEIHSTEHGRFHFQGRTTFYTPVLVTPRRHRTSK